MSVSTTRASTTGKTDGTTLGGRDCAPKPGSGDIARLGGGSLRAAAYLRYSERNGPSTRGHQLARATEWAAARGYIVNAVFEDVDVSARTLDRPALACVRALWAEFDVLVVTGWHVLSRSCLDLSTLRTEAERHGVALVAATGGCLDDALSRQLSALVVALDGGDGEGATVRPIVPEAVYHRLSADSDGPTTLDSQRAACEARVRALGHEPPAGRAVRADAARGE